LVHSFLLVSISFYGSVERLLTGTQLGKSTQAALIFYRLGELVCGTRSSAIVF